MMQRTQLLSITLVTIMVLAVVSGAGLLTATPAKAYVYDTPTKIGDLVYLPEYYYPTAVDVGDVYAWDNNYYHISYVIAENPDHPWSSAGIQSVSLQAAWTYVAPGDNGKQIPAVNGQIEKMFFVPPYGDSNTQLNYASKYEVPPIPDPSAPTSDFCGKVAVWVTDTSGRQDSIGVWACKDTGSTFSYVSDTGIMYLKYPPLNQPPIAEANGPYAGTAGQPVALSSAGSSDPDGSLTSYSWDFGDGSTASTNANPLHTYTAAGTYTVTLTVTDDKGATATDKTHADVTADPVPSVEAGGPYSTGTKNTVTLSGSATDLGTLTYAWSVVSQPKGAKVQFSDATAANPTVTFSKTGTYTLQLAVTDYMGQKGVDTAQVTVGVVAAQQKENPRQAGSSHIYFYDVAATSTHGTGKLMIDTAKHTFVFNGKKFTPDAMIELKARAEDGSDKVFATGKATPSGNLHIAGTWDKDVVPAAVTAGYTQVSAMGLFQEGWFVAKVSFYYSTDGGSTWTETFQSGGIDRPDEVWWSLDQFGVPYGALVKIHVTVVAGKDKTGSEVYQYTTSIGTRAMYEITGTTLNNKLAFDGYFENY